MSHIDHPFLAVPANQKQIGSPGIDRKLFMEDVKSGKYDDFTSFIFEEGWENLQNRQIPIPRKNCRDGKSTRCGGFPSFFRDFLARKDGKNLFPGTFPSFSGLWSPKKGAENGQLRVFPILHVFSRVIPAILRDANRGKCGQNHACKIRFCSYNKREKQ